MVQRASVGDIRAARSAGISPAMAPMAGAAAKAGLRPGGGLDIEIHFPPAGPFR
jgi:hypothetical protein